VTTTVDALQLRRVLGREDWSPPREFGPDGWQLVTRDDSSVIVTTAAYAGGEWTHASIAHPDRMPTYHELVLLKRAVWGDDGYAYQVFPARSAHVNIHSFALHLWGLSNGQRVLPEFGELGSI
jgi:hypothetical protein